MVQCLILLTCIHVTKKYRILCSVYWQLLFKRYIERIVLQAKTGNMIEIICKMKALVYHECANYVHVKCVDYPPKSNVYGIWSAQHSVPVIWK